MIGLTQAFHLGFWGALKSMYPLIVFGTIAGFGLFWRPTWYDRLSGKDDECGKRVSNPHLDEV